MTKDIPHPIGFQLAKILKLKRRYIDHEMKALNLSRTQWQTLISLNMLGPCSQKELLKYLDIDPAHLARVLENLEKNNYVVRTPIKDNRRSLLVQMTPHAKKHFIKKKKKTLATENAILLKGISPDDKKTLEKILPLLEKNMERALDDQQ